jgi:hypothetical protein
MPMKQKLQVNSTSSLYQPAYIGYSNSLGQKTLERHDALLRQRERVRKQINSQLEFKGKFDTIKNDEMKKNVMD